MRKAIVVTITVTCWALGALCAAMGVSFIFDGDRGTGIGDVIFLVGLGVALLYGGRAIGRKIGYGGEDLDKEDVAYLRGLEAGRKSRQMCPHSIEENPTNS